MDQIASELAEFLVQRLVNHDKSRRLLVGIAGIPASGKSTFAQLVVGRTNRLWRQKNQPSDSCPDNATLLKDRGVAILVGLDGWHLTRAQLDTLPDPQLAHDRRGADWTFDGKAYVRFVEQIRKPISSLSSATVAPESSSYLARPRVIYAPSFSHEIKDPTPDAVAIHPYHRIVIIEGLYTFLNTVPWVIASHMLDERWWVEVRDEEAEERLIARHVKSGVAKDLEGAVKRAKENDGPNGEYIRENLMEPTRVIQSIEDSVFTSL